VNDPVVWIAIGASLVFVAVLVWKGLWLLRKISAPPEDE
jgi:heme exporter protein D